MGLRIGSICVLLIVCICVIASSVRPPLDVEGASASLYYRDLGITHGVHLEPISIPPDYTYGDEILAFNTLTEKDIGVLMYYTAWQGNSYTGTYFDPYPLILIADGITDPSRRPVILLTWEPLYGSVTWGCDKNYSGLIPPTDIIEGDCDVYLTNVANELNARPERFIMRFAHEMNISDSPWWPGHFPGEDASLYVSMYRHVNQIFVDAGVDNVEWLWSPNYASYPDVAWNAIPNYYPGDDVVDWIGLSGYNWYKSPGHLSSPWQSFEYLFDDVLKDLACRYAKPQIIAEIGSVEGDVSSPSKADWIADAYLKAPNYPFLRSIVWFNDYAGSIPTNPDFRVTTTSQPSGPPNVSPLPAAPPHAWTQAYQAAIANSTYNSTFPSLTAATPPHPICTELFLPIITR